MTPRELKAFDKKVHVEPNTGCWLWVGATVYGYGCVKQGDKVLRAHRVSYERHRGPIPAGLVIDHLCRQRCCVNPDHLEAVPQRDNVLRGESHVARWATRTHCDRGHAFDSRNTITRENGTRRCRECRNARQRKARSVSL